MFCLKGKRSFLALSGLESRWEQEEKIEFSNVGEILIVVVSGDLSVNVGAI